MLRFTVCIIIAACFTLIYQQHERIKLANTLLGTFSKFPLSNLNIVSIPSVIPTTLSNESSSVKVPAVIHQVLLGDLNMRTEWSEARASCQKLHPSWQFKLWQDHEANSFVQQYYPKIYSTYRYYPLEIQRSNVLRYLILHHYGGIYLDLDMRCRQSLDFLRNVDFLTPPANPTGVNNAFIVSKKGHPFWQHVIDHLIQYDVDWLTPYVTNMFSTGCHFLSTMHRTYSDQIHLKILDSTHKLNGHVVTPLFEHLGSSSWHKKDAKWILRYGRFAESLEAFKLRHRWSLRAVMVLLLVVLLLLVVRHRYRKYYSNKFKKTDYQVLPRWEMQENEI